MSTQSRSILTYQRIKPFLAPGSSSARRARRSPIQQKKAVELDRNKEQAQNLAAAAAIKSLLAQKPQRIDLVLLASQIIHSI
jgi:hypothetical protein